MTKISILGCGWLGKPLGAYLAKKGYDIKGSTTSPDKLSDLEERKIRPYLMRLDPEGPSGTGFFDCDVLMVNLPPRKKDDIADFHQKQLEWIRSEAKSSGVRKILFISSSSVYPSNNKVVTEEDADENCLSRAGISLLRMEQIFAKDTAFDTTVLRFGGLYGPKRHPGRFLSGKKDVSGALNPINMIHLDDCIGIIDKIVERGMLGNTWNACSPNHITRKEFYEQAAKDLGIDPPIFNDEPADFKIVNSDRLVHALGYIFLF